MPVGGALQQMRSGGPEGGGGGRRARQARTNSGVMPHPRERRGGWGGRGATQSYSCLPKQVWMTVGWLMDRRPATL